MLSNINYGARQLFRVPSHWLEKLTASTKPRPSVDIDGGHGYLPYEIHASTRVSLVSQLRQLDADIDVRARWLIARMTKAGVEFQYYKARKDLTI